MIESWHSTDGNLKFKVHKKIDHYRNNIIVRLFPRKFDHIEFEFHFSSDHPIKISTQRWYDTLARFIGLSNEHQLNHDQFDKSFFINCESASTIEKICGSYEQKHALFQLKSMGMLFLKINSRGARIFFKKSSLNFEKLVNTTNTEIMHNNKVSEDTFKTILDYTTIIAKPLKKSIDTSANMTEWLWYLGYTIFKLFILLIVGIFTDNEILGNLSPLEEAMNNWIFISFFLTFLSVSFYIYTFPIKSSTHRAAFLLFLIGWPIIHIFGYPLAANINRIATINPSPILYAPIIDKKSIKRTGRRNKATLYKAIVIWPNDKPIIYKIDIKSEEHIFVRPNNQCYQLQTATGLFGLEYFSIEGTVNKDKSDACNAIFINKQYIIDEYLSLNTE
ncbi:hypothetical protein [Pseudemcibacter aquimaris]|uniref:hypothetical protein n=1 Tax=Pseudemcibacter aquimaris TaxID=2857064 RepID=UPI002011785E|nr:hypothetical protein [Pseudemcibacter aquimaris]MCC3860394.1 hypothetical protein [Pseudemcibacter aquimaris]WDU57720.1 hypothetical protein KW060_10985 [Pseudemcibacter aquimaris]